MVAGPEGFGRDAGETGPDRPHPADRFPHKLVVGHSVEARPAELEAAVELVEQRADTVGPDLHRCDTTSGGRGPSEPAGWGHSSERSRLHVVRDAIEVHLATADELPQVGAVLGRAFFDDRIYRWLVPDDVQRRQSTRAFYSILAEACWPHGAVYVAGSAVGAALWLPPGVAPVDEEAATGLPAVPAGHRG